MEILILKAALKELHKGPKERMQDLYSLFEDLTNGKMLSMPISRPLPTIAKGLHEIRLSSRSGEFRVYYLIWPGQRIDVIHASQKKSQAINKSTTQLLIKRIRSVSK